MAVTLIEGFKHVPVAGDRLTALATTTGTTTYSRQANRGGGYSLRATNTSTSDATTAVGRLLVPLASQSFSVGFAMNHRIVANLGTSVTGFSVADAGPSAIYNIATPTGYAVSGGVAAGVSVLTTVDSSPTTLGWHWWNVVAVMNNATAGFFRVYRDGVLLLQASPDTLASSAGPAMTVFIYMGNSNATALSGVDVADLIVRDDTNLITDSRVDVLAPASDVAAGWTRSAGTTNYSLVDDAGPTIDTSDYVSANTVGAVDTYGVADLPFNPASVYAVGVHAVGRKLGGGIRDSCVMLNGTDGPTQSIGSNGLTYGYWETNPSGGAAWTAATVNSMTAGIKIKT